MTTELAPLPSDLMAQLAQDAREVAAAERPNLSRLSTKSGVLSYAGNSVPGNSLDVVIVAAVELHTLYTNRFDPNKPENPKCFSLTLVGGDAVPHENAEDAQHDDCDTCPKNMWGSDPGGGRGKACKEKRRLIVIPASALATPEAVASAELAILDVPVTSVKNYVNYAQVVAASAKLPLYAVVTNITIKPDAKTQFKVEFKAVKTIGDAATIGAVMALRERAEQAALTPFEETPEQGQAMQQAAEPAKKQKF